MSDTLKADIFIDKKIRDWIGGSMSGAIEVMLDSKRELVEVAQSYEKDLGKAGALIENLQNKEYHLKKDLRETSSDRDSARIEEEYWKNKFNAAEELNIELERKVAELEDKLLEKKSGE